MSCSPLHLRKKKKKDVYGVIEALEDTVEFIREVHAMVPIAECVFCFILGAIEKRRVDSSVSPPLIDWISHGITNWIYPDPDPFVSHANISPYASDYVAAGTFCSQIKGP